MEAIREAGERAGKAMKQGDYARAKFEREFSLKMIRLEDDQDRAERAFNEAYKNAKG